MIKVLLLVSMIALQSLRESYFRLLLSTVIVVIPQHPSKGFVPMLVTLPGIFILIRLQQSLKALSPILVRLPGRVILARLLHSLKAANPILVTLSGSITLARLVHPEKDSSPIVMTVDGITILRRFGIPAKAACPTAVMPSGTKEFLQPAINVLLLVSMMALQLARESYCGFSGSTAIDDNSLHK